MSAEQKPRVLSFLAETAPLATAIAALVILFTCFPTQRSGPTVARALDGERSQAVAHSALSSKSLDDSAAPGNVSLARATLERLPPVARCERLPAVDESPLSDTGEIENGTPTEQPTDASVENRTVQDNPPSLPSVTAAPPLPTARIHSSVSSPGGLDRTAWQAETAVAMAHHGNTANQVVVPAVLLPDSVELQARERLTHAYGRADRGALYSARREFLSIFRTITNSLDAGVHPPVHTNSLAQALCALEEADDFITADRYMATPAQLEGLIASHQTSVLKDVDISRLNPRIAMQTYYDFASKNLARAGHSQPISSEVLYALGRVEMLMLAEAAQRTGSAPKAAAYFTAALAVDPNHGLAANELGVLFARSGRLQEAHGALEHAARSQPTPTVLQNLADVQQRIAASQGRPAADFHSSPVTRPASHQASSSLMSQVQFVDPRTFAQLSENPGVTSAVGTAPLGTPPPPNGTSVPPSREQNAWFGF